MDDDDEYPITFPSASSPPNTTFLPDDGIMELLWQNGPVVMPCQNHGPPRKPPPPKDPGDVTTLATEVEIRPSPQVENCSSQLLFMQEDEMASWLHSPIVDNSPLDHNFYLLYSPHTAVNDSATMQPSTSEAPPALPMPPTWEPQAKIQESEQFSKHNASIKSGLSRSRTTARESTVVDSCDTPIVVATSRASDAVIRTAEPAERAACRSMNTAEIVGPSTTTASGGTEAMACEMTATSSPGGSTGSAELSNRSPAEDRKRKGREANDSECHIDDSAEAKQEVGGSKSTKRSRAAEVHNLSERRRRDRINEKMRALQELIPRCNKSDKASMLDEAIEYLKSLQLQVQMMSMGCGMVPMNMMMCPGMPVMPFPAHMGPSLSRMPDNMLTSLPSSHPIHSRIPNLPHAYPQYLGPHQIQSHFMQNQTMMQQDISKPSTSRAHENPENHHSGPI